MQLKKLNDKTVDQLFEAVLTLKTVEECYIFFEDLCTVNEIQSLSQRLEVARMLRKGSTYNQIETETGASTGAIQIAGTDSDHQLPFFVTTCDYTLIGEELYAASAYLSREPVQVGTLLGQDVGKLAVLSLIALGSIAATLKLGFGVEWAHLLLDVLRDVK